MTTFLLIGCAETPSPTPTLTPATEPVTLDIGVSHAAAKVGEILTNDFASSPGDIELKILAGNGQTLLMDLEKGLLDAVVVHYPDQFPQLWQNPIAMDGLVFVSNLENPLEEIIINDLRTVFGSGIHPARETLNAGESVSIIVPEPGSGILELFQERVMEDQSITSRARVLPDSQIIPDIVMAEPNSLGLTAMGVNDQNQTLAVEGVLPLPATVHNQSYPLSIPVFFVSQSEPAGELRVLLSWIQSDFGQLALSDYYGRVR